ncbi:MAG: polyprenyl synthetase family protein, partial [Firmicutes bacterium]|nr:polyprenyl synthetase family protein [Bacillota bacterium]
MTFDCQYAAYRDALEAALARYLDASGAPEPLLGAMRYSLLAGGKRLRPVLLLAACEMGGGDLEAAMPFACGLEMIHAYSLIHDDLPAMDNDDLRRGKPTNHKVFGEGMAVLAGDGLLSLAFAVMLDAAETPAAVDAARQIARAAGVAGMVGGQCADIACGAEKRGGADELMYIHRHKTAGLFTGGVCAGLTLAGAQPILLEAGAAYAAALGLAFQIRDDLLDIEGNAAVLGKATGMDASAGKLTWP